MNTSCVMLHPTVLKAWNSISHGISKLLPSIPHPVQGHLRWLRRTGSLQSKRSGLHLHRAVDSKGSSGTLHCAFARVSSSAPTPFFGAWRWRQSNNRLMASMPLRKQPPKPAVAPTAGAQKSQTQGPSFGSLSPVDLAGQVLQATPAASLSCAIRFAMLSVTQTLQAI